MRDTGTRKKKIDTRKRAKLRMRTLDYQIAFRLSNTWGLISIKYVEILLLMSDFPVASNVSQSRSSGFIVKG